MHQTHSSNAIVLDSSNKSEILKCDGIVTKESNKILSVLTADCSIIIL